MGPKKKKKLTKEERARLRAEEIERIKKEEELERQRLAREAEERIVQERLQREERARQEIREQALREQQLAHTAQVIKECDAIVHTTEEQRKQQQQWELYMRCDGLPDPASPPAMHTYLHVWRSDEEGRDVDQAVAKTAEVLGLLTHLDELLEEGDAPENLQKLWQEVRQEIRDEQQRRLDEATYGLLRRASHLQCNDLDPTIVRFHHDTSPHLTLSLWASLVPPSPLSCEFSQLGVSVQLPPQLSGLHAAIRALWLRYDHFSDQCPSREAPPPPEHHNQDLESLTLAEWQDKLERAAEEKLRKEQEIEEPPVVETVPEVVPEQQVTPEDQEIEGEENEDETAAPEPPRDEQAEREREEREAMTRVTEPCELNLRKFTVLGGVLHLDLLEQPPQPRELSKHLALTVLTEPLELRRVNFHARYCPPPPPEPGKRRLPEEIEAELKLQEQEFEKLALVNITLPETVLWFEPPIVVGWDSEKNYWGSENLHDLKFNEEKQILTFRAGRLGPLALAAFRYSNLPYQTWEMKPGSVEPGTVTLTITAAVVLVEFTFKDDMVCLSQLQNGTTSALQDIVGQYHKPNVLIKLMRRGGVDVFPPHDAHCYMAAVSPKQRPSERHLYRCMALAGKTHCFAWSRWNLLAGYSNMVLQMRESLEDETGKLPNYDMLLVTSQRACVVQCTEVSQSFSEDAATGMKFYADLLHLLLTHGSPTARENLENPNVPLAHSLATILEATRVLSFS